jgi:hypothetical protein
MNACPKSEARIRLMIHLDHGRGYSMTDEGIILLQTPLNAAPSSVLELFDEEFRQLNELEVMDAPSLPLRVGSVWRCRRNKRMLRITWSTPLHCGVTYRVEDRLSPTMDERRVEDIRRLYIEC